MAEPYRPSSENIVLEELRPANDPISRELRALRAEVERRPDDLGPALALVGRYIEASRATGDPRYTGYAEAMIEPFAAADPAPPDALVMRATVRQRQHDFSGAIEDLSDVLRASPDHPQALLTRSSLHLVLGDYREASADCAALAGRTLPLIVSACQAGVDAMTGRADESAIRLAAALTRTHPETPPGVRTWALTMLGELDQRLGRWSSAVAHFEDAAAIDGDDLYLRSAWIDLLLDRGEADAALTLIGDDLRADALLLRRALVARALDEDALPALVDELSSRFAAAALRKDQRHLREEARFRLRLKDQPEEALALALANWSLQKELWDGRLVLETALAAGRPEAAEPALTWMEAQGWYDATLDPLIRRLREGAKP